MAAALRHLHHGAPMRRLTLRMEGDKRFYIGSAISDDYDTINVRLSLSAWNIRQNGEWNFLTTLRDSVMCA